MRCRGADMDLRSLYAVSPPPFHHSGIGTRREPRQRQEAVAVFERLHPDFITFSLSALSSCPAKPFPPVDSVRSLAPVFHDADYFPTRVPSFVTTNDRFHHQPQNPSNATSCQPQQLAASILRGSGSPHLIHHHRHTESDTESIIGSATKHFSAASHPNKAFDFNPSAALTSSSATSVLQEGYDVKTSKTTALMMSDNSLSSSAEEEHSPRTPPRYRPLESPSSCVLGSDLESRTSENLFDLDAPVNGIGHEVSSGDDEQDSFAYDNRKPKACPHVHGPGNHDRRTRASSRRDASRAYPCPFRKRDPVMFNVRDHEQCAIRPFFGMSQLIHHIRTYHKARVRPHLCPRCKRGFQSSSGMAAHLMVPAERICAPNNTYQDQVFEFGISEDVDKALADRTPGRSAQCRNWKQIWQLLFPEDECVLNSDYIPVVEMDEMEHILDKSQTELKTDLSESLQRLLPDQSEDVRLFLTGQFLLVFEQHMVKVNRKCRSSFGEGTHLIHSSNRTDKSMVVPSRTLEGSTLRPPNPAHSRDASQQSSSRPRGRRHSRAQHLRPSRKTVSPASSTSSGNSRDPDVVHANRRESTARSNAFNMSAMQVESPRLPFRDWVQGLKFNTKYEQRTYEQKTYQRDSGLALEHCDACLRDPCQCERYYTDEVLALRTTAAAARGRSRGIELGSEVW